MDGLWIIIGLAGVIVGAIGTLIWFTWYLTKDL